ncbi:MAG: response regulator, partial [Burkholderiales bacterium]|nr:response regulator [Opitutaceae bacterium]
MPLPRFNPAPLVPEIARFGPPAPPDPNNPMTRVLIVDDKEDNLDYLRSLLSAHGCTVDSAHDGAEALAQARSSPPDLVVSDLLMPVMDGYTLLRHWKADARLHQVPFIVFTATYTDPDDERLALNLGADAFILKHAEPEHLIARLREVQTNAVAPSPVPPRVAVQDENTRLKLYSEVLVRKLEERTQQLATANRDLRQKLAERKIADEKIRVLAESQMAILNALPAHIALVDPEGVILSVNEAWRRFALANVLQSPDFCVGQNYLKVCEQAVGDCSSEAQAIATGIRRVLRGGQKEFVIEYPCHSPDEQRWFRLMVTPLQEERLAGAVIMHVNITERKRDESELRLAERAARESEARLGFALAAADVGDWSLDLRTNVAHRSLRHDQCFGYREAVPQWGYDTFLAHIQPADRDRVAACFKTAMAGQGEYDAEFRTTWPDASVHWLWTKGRFYFDETGDPYRVAGIVSDITARKQAELALLESEARHRQISAQLAKVLDS